MDPHCRVIIHTQLSNYFLNFIEYEEKDNAGDVIVQSMSDLNGEDGEDPCKNDVEAFAKAIEPYGVKPENIFKHENNATTLLTSGTYQELRKMFRQNPEKRYAVLHVYAGHGMTVDGKQVILLN